MPAYAKRYVLTVPTEFLILALICVCPTMYLAYSLDAVSAQEKVNVYYFVHLWGDFRVSMDPQIMER